MSGVTEKVFMVITTCLFYKNPAGTFVAVALYNSIEYTKETLLERKPVVEGYELTKVVMKLISGVKTILQ